MSISNFEIRISNLGNGEGMVFAMGCCAAAACSRSAASRGRFNSLRISDLGI